MVRCVRKLGSLFVALALILGLTPIMPSKAEAQEAEVVAVLAEISGAEFGDSDVIVKFNDDIDSAVVEETLNETRTVKGKSESEPDEIAENTAVVKIADSVSVAEAIADLRNNPNVEYVEPDYVVTLDDAMPSPSNEAVNDPLLSDQWYVTDSASRVQSAWSLAKCNHEVTVAFVDSGCTSSQTDLKNNVIYGINFTTEDSADYSDSYGHGTAVAGVISAESNNGYLYSGVSYNANLVAVKVFEGKKASLSTVVKGINWVTQNKEAYGISILNMSFGTDEPSASLEDAINSASDAGILCVCASGNDSSSSSLANVKYPAAYSSTIAVGAIDASHNRSYFSNGGSALDVVAPGSNINTLSNNGDDCTANKSGTSFSTPFTSGIAALCKAMNPDATTAQLTSYLTDTAIDLGVTGKDDYYGYGQVDAYAAVLAAWKDAPAGATEPDSDDPSKVQKYSIFSPKDDTSLDAFKARVWNALLNRENNVDVLDFGIKASDITYENTYGATLTEATALAAMTRSHPLFSTLCVDWSSFSFEEVEDGTISTVVIAGYLSTWTDDLIDSFMANYNEFYSNAPIDGTDIQKAGYVHDWICSHTTYSQQTQYLPDFAIGCIRNGKALCAGYAYAYQFLCQQLGMECNYVTGTTKSGGAHAWNKIRVEGRWFLVDSCWDGSFTSATNPNNFSHNYFLVNDEEFKTAGDGGHAGDTNVLGDDPANDTYYFANKFWSGITGPIAQSDYAEDAKLSAKTYTVSYETNGGSQLTAQTVTKGDTAQRPDDPTKIGYAFDGWFTDAGLTNSFDFNAAITANMVLYAKWSRAANNVTRLAGNDCYGTNWATMTCDYNPNNPPSGVIVCTTSHYIDALSAAALSGLLNYPILLVNGSSGFLNSEADQSMNAITGNGSRKIDVIILGGTAAVSVGVESQLEAYDSNSNCTRIWGASGYDTNLEVYKYGENLGGWNKEVVLVATGGGYHDALGSGSFASAKKAFIFIANPESENRELISAVASRSNSQTVILGGTAAVSQSLEDSIRANCSNVQRIGGADCFGTNIAFVSYALNSGMSLVGAGFSTNLGYYDALGSSHVLGKNNAVMFLVSMDESHNQAVYQTVRSYGDGYIGEGFIFGGNAVVTVDFEKNVNGL